MIRHVDALSASKNKPPLNIIAGQRCLHLKAKYNPVYPPLVVVVGMAQTVSIWEQYVASTNLAAERDVLIYEPAGLAGNTNTNNNNNNKLSVEDDDNVDDNAESKLLDVSLPTQADRLKATIETVFGKEDSVDVAGFSLGGRIVMAAACKNNNIANNNNNNKSLFRKIHLTGVALQRSDYGYVQLFQWKDHLRNNDLRAFAWAAITATYSNSFLRQNLHRLPVWVDAVCTSQSTHGLLALMEQTHEEQGEWSVAGMAERLSRRQQQQRLSGRLLVGQWDQMAPVEYVHALGECLQWPVQVVPDVGHAVPGENTRAWAQDVLDFLGQDVLESLGQDLLDILNEQEE